MTAVHLFRISADMTEDHANSFTAINHEIVELAGRRRQTISVSGHLARSKIAWKIETFAEAVLYRLVALAEGTALSWNAAIPLPAFLCTRAIVETVALLVDFEARTAKLLEAEDLKGLDELTMNRIFSSRDEEWVRAEPKFKTVNVMTHIEKLDRLLPGALGHYERLSERCHPNWLGHHEMFASTDYRNGTVTYDSSKAMKDGTAIIAGLTLLGVVEHCLRQLRQLSEKVSELHHRVRPSPLD
ncbi:hypothetical protein [Bradyrhizobium japonicum]|uniref:hypothetical protein n=1 Tax=Bradyrhizobium japonicum TaxID=375 RepID=UPI00040995ED|nr:hypothetical protein [Bradyrhizobium japonicum]